MEVLLWVGGYALGAVVAAYLAGRAGVPMLAAFAIAWPVTLPVAALIYAADLGEKHRGAK